MFLLLSISNLHAVQAQEKKVVKIDSVEVKQGSYVLIDDEILFIKQDTTLIFRDSLRYGIGNTDDEKFYQQLKKLASKKKWSKKLYDLLIIEPGENSNIANRSNLFIASQRLNRYQGRRIAALDYKQLPPFGVSIDDTTQRERLVLEKIGNNLHSPTKKFVVENNLLLNQGDLVDLETIHDAERILRELPFIKDARIVPIDSISSGDSVSLQILTQDVFAYSLAAKFHGVKGGALELTHNNFLGLGHQFRNEISYNRNYPERKIGYGAMYRIPNIHRTFISAEANYSSRYDRKLTNIALARDFVSPGIEYAGGLDIGQKFSREWFLDQGSEEVDIDTLLSTHNYQNFWLGRAFKVNFINPRWSNRSRLVVSARYLRKKYIERPEVTESLNPDFQNSQLIMGSLSFSTSQYFTDRLVYSYGRTEDIPYGQKLTFTGGYEKNEFSNRRLVGMDFSMARFFNELGYVYGQIIIESYFRNGKSEQGIIRPSINYISDLSKWGRFKIRHFLDLELTRGINRFNNEFLTINREAGIRGFKSEYVMGHQRLTIHYELVAFSPVDYVGFRLAPYFFYDAALLAQNNDAVYKGNYYHGLGLGIRLRNDNLTFNAIEVRLGFYPHSPADVSGMGLDFSESRQSNFRDFTVKAPNVTPFR